MNRAHRQMMMLAYGGTNNISSIAFSRDLNGTHVSKLNDVPI